MLKLQLCEWDTLALLGLRLTNISSKICDLIAISLLVNNANAAVAFLAHGGIGNDEEARHKCLS